MIARRRHRRRVFILPPIAPGSACKYKVFVWLHPEPCWCCWCCSRVKRDWVSSAAGVYTLLSWNSLPLTRSLGFITLLHFVFVRRRRRRFVVVSQAFCHVGHKPAENCERNPFGFNLGRHKRGIDGCPFRPIDLIIHGRLRDQLPSSLCDRIHTFNDICMYRIYFILWGIHHYIMQINDSVSIFPYGEQCHY